MDAADGTVMYADFGNHVLPDDVSYCVEMPEACVVTESGDIVVNERMVFGPYALSGIEDLTQNSNDTWLNLQGQPAERPSGGVFIRVSEEGKAEKVMRR